MINIVQDLQVYLWMESYSSYEPLYQYEPLPSQLRDSCLKFVKILFLTFVVEVKSLLTDCLIMTVNLTHSNILASFFFSSMTWVIFENLKLKSSDSSLIAIAVWQSFTPFVLVGPMFPLNRLVSKTSDKTIFLLSELFGLDSLLETDSLLPEPREGCSKLSSWLSTTLGSKLLCLIHFLNQHMTLFQA